MRYLAVLAAGAALVFTSSTAVAAAHIQNAELSVVGNTLVVEGRVVGNHDDPLNLRANVTYSCSDGTSWNIGIGAQVFTGKGPYEFTLAAPVGCDITSAELRSVTVS